MTDPADKPKWTRCFSKEANMIRIDGNGLVGIAYVPLQIDLSKSDDVANHIIAAPLMREALTLCREVVSGYKRPSERHLKQIDAALAAARGES